jgi:hypothetical protein
MVVKSIERYAVLLTTALYTYMKNWTTRSSIRAKLKEDDAYRSFREAIN